MNNKRANGKPKRITSSKMQKLHAKIKPKQDIIAIRRELEYGESIKISGRRDLITKKTKVDDKKKVN